MQSLFLFQITKLPKYLVIVASTYMNSNKGYSNCLVWQKISKILDHQHIINILAENTTCYNYLLFKLVAPRYSMGNQNSNALPKITLNGSNTLLESTCYIFLNHVRSSSFKNSEQTKIKPLKVAKCNKENRECSI